MTALSYQLYSSRMFPPLEDTLSMLAEIGYAHVEGYGALVADADAMDALERGLQATGLTMPSCHVGLAMCESDPDGVLRIAERFGIETVVIPFIMPEDRPTDVAGWLAFGARLSAVAEKLAKAGRRLAYHNHDFEFVPLADGSLPIDLILEAAPEVLFEYDVAWAVRAAADPMAPIDRYGARIAIAHLKDIAPEGEAADEEGWADVGHGTMEWPTLFNALKAAGTRYFAAEHDNPSDHRRFAQRSFDATQTF
ncbi:sugar phosphate isomerase/epimerase [Tateyamaria omphalii]|uniref:sugar phosphate isomerase/epimerase family protein n=1 Tax=Tateyamaria omphalii TaxID=299262 RepID=UPI001C99A39B|nr:sugar phosphate isomerase/epimerase [Tateyamaria omphalii]MBY5934120.1 sugar phosphate isomerase/epimerase [Tateyamaria omphalii]